ncbi:MAG: tetratricopeptide repeat protein [Pyrinomonadaceae bacterium]
MNFDKTKAMRSAERYVAQGKLRAAISEYRSVVDNDPRDIATLNMLGDLYAKNSEKRDAVQCYLQVADHYNAQGFSQKAIAIYNKITRIQPDSIEVSAKLAELHKSKGSLSEARSHYATLAEHYQKNGRRLEALSMFKQIALLDPNNTDVCLNLADSYLREGQRDDAVEAYSEAGSRFSRQNRHEEAIRALMKGYDIRSTDLRILEGLVKAQTALGRAGKAASLLEEIIENEPYNRDVLYLLIECCLDSQNAPAAEKAVIKLVEIEPANYPKFLDLIRIYLNVNDPESAARILTMSSEYLLAGGQSDECGKWINEILERNPNQLSGLRLLVRYNTWLNDETGIRLALERLYTAASKLESIDDERFTLAQLVVIRPHETRYRDRLNEINQQFGFEDTAFEEQPANSESEAAGAVVTSDAEIVQSNGHKPDFAAFEPDGIEGNGNVLEAQIVENMADVSGGYERPDKEFAVSTSTHSGDQKVQKEIESINFYIDNDYKDLAVKALTELTQEFGERGEFAALRKRIGSGEKEEVIAATIHEELAGNPLGIDQIRSEFGLEDTESGEESDYDTHYHTAVAYQEMGLTEQAISEFQDAINLTTPNDGTRRFFQCANLLGHCFLQNGMANHAITWLIRALETANISDEEHHGLWYELALAYEANGNDETAAKYFEQIYAENVDFRDVGDRVKHLATQH